jgi:hypothetical protein
VSGPEVKDCQDVSHWASSGCLSFLLRELLKRGLDYWGGNEMLKTVASGSESSFPTKTLAIPSTLGR